MTTARRPSSEARQSASAVRSAAARAASKKPLLAKAIPQQSPSIPSGTRTATPAQRRTSCMARAGGTSVSPGSSPTMRVRQLGK